MTPERLVRELMVAFETSDWERLRLLYHDRARLVTVAGGSVPLGPDETIAAFRAALRDVPYQATFSRVEQVDDHAALLYGQVRFRPPAGRGFTQARRVWTITLREGLLWRQHVYENEREAIAAYRRLGLDLGTPDEPS
jgi:hypothetical protein